MTEFEAAGVFENASHPPSERIANRNTVRCKRESGKRKCEVLERDQHLTPQSGGFAFRAALSAFARRAASATDSIATSEAVEFCGATGGGTRGCSVTCAGNVSPAFRTETVSASASWMSAKSPTENWCMLIFPLSS